MNTKFFNPINNIENFIEVIFDNSIKSLHDSYLTNGYLNSNIKYRYKFIENESKYLIEINLPNYNKEDLNISYKESTNTLLVKSILNEEDFWRKKIKKEFKFVHSLNFKEIKSKLSLGILTIDIPIVSEEDSILNVNIE